MPYSILSTLGGQSGPSFQALRPIIDDVGEPTSALPSSGSRPSLRNGALASMIVYDDFLLRCEKSLGSGVFGSSDSARSVLELQYAELGTALRARRLDGFHSLRLEDAPSASALAEGIASRQAALLAWLNQNHTLHDIVSRLMQPAAGGDDTVSRSGYKY